MINLDTLTTVHAAIFGLLATINADLINGTFEAMAGIFMLNNCRVLYTHKQVRGVSVISATYFTLWGFWNLYYYPALNQPLSFYGGLFVVVANALYVSMLVKYFRQMTNFTGGSPSGISRVGVVRPQKAAE